MNNTITNTQVIMSLQNPDFSFLQKYFQHLWTIWQFCLYHLGLLHTVPWFWAILLPTGRKGSFISLYLGSTCYCCNFLSLLLVTHNRCELTSHVALVGIYKLIGDNAFFFIVYLSAVHIAWVEKCLFKSFDYFLISLILVLSVYFMCSLFLFEHQTLSRYMVCEYSLSYRIFCIL